MRVLVNCFTVKWGGGSLKKTRRLATPLWFPHEMTSEEEHRNAILMTRHYPDLVIVPD